MNKSITEEPEEEPTASTHFIARRRPPENSSTGRRSSSRPHSIGALIISNPKIVKGWQYYDNSPHQKDIRRYFSTINVGDGTSTTTSASSAAADQPFLPPPVPPPSEKQNTPPRNKNRENVYHMSMITTAYPTSNPVYGETTTPTGIEIKPCIADPDPQPHLCTPILGIILTLVSTTLLGLSAVFRRSLPYYQYHPYNTLVWASQGLLWPSFVLLLCPCQMRSVTLSTKGCPKWVTITLLILRSLFGWTSAIFLVEALKWIPGEDVGTVFWGGGPVLVILLAWLVLNERPGVMGVVIAVFVVIGGVSMIIQFGKGIEEVNILSGRFWKGAFFAGGALLLEGVCSVVILRRLRFVHFAVVTFVYGLVGMGGGVCLYFWGGEGMWKMPEGGGDIWLAVVIGVMTFLGEVGFTGALKWENCGVVGVVRSWHVVVVVLGNWWFLGEEVNWFT